MMALDAPTAAEGFAADKSSDDDGISCVVELLDQCSDKDGDGK